MGTTTTPNTATLQPPVGQSRWEVLQKLFRFFEREGLPYVVLGDYSKVRDEREGDVDIAVSQETLRRFPKLLVRFATMVEARVVQSIRHESTSYFFVLAWQGRDGRTHLLQIDACSDYRRSGRTLITADLLLKDRRSAQLDGTDIAIPNPSIGLAYYLVKKVEKDQLDESHIALLRQLAEAAKAEPALETLADQFGPAATPILEAGLKDGEWELVGESLPALREHLRNRRPRSRDSLLFESRRILQRLFVQTGFEVVVFGPDGSGKSTVIESLREEMSHAFWGTQYFHLRPRIGTGVVHGESTPVENPHGQKPRNPVSSVLKLFYYAADYLIGHWSSVKPLLLRSRLVIFDRYYHDILVDPVRYRYSGPAWLARFVGRFIPRPDLFIFLDAPAHIIQQRKNEVSPEETQRQSAEYRKLARSLKPSVVVDAGAPVNDVTSAAVDALLDKLAERLEKRSWLR